jgi:hypothetical protein
MAYEPSFGVLLGTATATPIDAMAIEAIARVTDPTITGIMVMAIGATGN